jgi:hypothetical protein
VEYGKSELGALLGPEETSCVDGFSGCRFCRGASNACLCGWWCVGGGVWLFVECCIVDASILLW